MLGLGFAASARAAAEPTLPPMRVITRGPRRHWFGYYDKLQFDPTGRYCLGMEVDFEHRSPRPDDVIQIGMVDLKDNDRWIELGKSTAWCWQQGCMLQWVPGSKTTVLWNDRDNDRYVCRILNVQSRELRTIPHPIYALSPDGKLAIAPDFRRLADVRPGYGYNGISDPNAEKSAPDDTGIFRIDLESGRQELILTVADVVRFGRALPSMKETKHWFNHLLLSPDGSRFVFLHRWKVGTGRETRMLTAALDGSDLRVVDDNGLTSHFIWRDPKHLLAFSKQPAHGSRFYLFEDRTGGSIEAVGPDVMTQDGHCTYVPGGEWILNDTYPDAHRRQNPYLYHVKTGRKIPLGHFVSPPPYTGEWRCDTHPRVSPAGRTVVIDSPAGETGRQLHLIDISRIVA
jgi:hypothetical protein